MIQDLKTGFKLMKYGAQYKQTILSVIFIFAIGVAFEIFSHGTQFIGCFYLLLLAVFPMQLVFSTDVSTMIQTTKMKRKIQITIPITMNAILMTVTYAVICIIRVYEVQKYPEDQGMMINNLVLLGVTSLIFLGYMGACFKHFMASLAIFLVVFMATYTPLLIIFEFHKDPLVSLPIAIVIGYLGIVLGLVVQYAFLRLFYKHEMSKYAFGAQIRKLMQ